VFDSGYVATNSELVNISDAYSDDRFNKEIDKKLNYKTNTILACPVFDTRENKCLGVI